MRDGIFFFERSFYLPSLQYSFSSPPSPRANALGQVPTLSLFFLDLAWMLAPSDR